MQDPVVRALSIAAAVLAGPVGVAAGVAFSAGALFLCYYMWGMIATYEQTTQRQVTVSAVLWLCLAVPLMALLGGAPIVRIAAAIMTARLA